MTGTPIFNQVQDLNALLQFLRIYPFDDLPYFNTQVTQLLKTHEEKGLQRLKSLFKCVALRRTKDAVVDDLKLPVRQDTVCVVNFNPQEDKMYKFLRRSLSYFFHAAATETKKGGFSGGILPTITRLRRFCNHKLDLLPREIRRLVEDFADGQSLAHALITDLTACDLCNKESTSEGDNGVT